MTKSLQEIVHALVPSSQEIPDAAVCGLTLDSNQVKKGDSLMVTFGTFMDRDENGDMAILSYAQSALKTNSPNSQKAAFNVAKLKAERAIIQFRSENVEIAEKMETFEVTTE